MTAISSLNKFKDAELELFSHFNLPSPKFSLLVEDCSKDKWFIVKNHAGVSFLYIQKGKLFTKFKLSEIIYKPTKQLSFDEIQESDDCCSHNAFLISNDNSSFAIFQDHIFKFDEFSEYSTYSFNLFDMANNITDFDIIQNIVTEYESPFYYYKKNEHIIRTIVNIEFDSDGSLELAEIHNENTNIEDIEELVNNLEEEEYFHTRHQRHISSKQLDKCKNSDDPTKLPF